MVVNFPVACAICGCSIRLRYQVSEVFCPIKFQCPECKTEIGGSIQTIWHEGKERIEIFPWHYDFKLKNATKVEECVCKYVLEISPDLSTNTIMLNNENIGQYIPTPYMRQAFTRGGIKNQNTRFYNFIESWENCWDDMKIKMDLCYNEKYDILLIRLLNTYDIFPKDINCIISTHQELLKFCVKILPKNTLKEYTKMNKKLNSIVESNLEGFNEFVNLYDLNYTKQLERKTLQLIKTFLDIYPKFLPIFNTLNRKDYKELGVSTLTFEDIKSFYQDAYELILYSTPRIIALNNLYCRKSINNFKEKTEEFHKKINSYNSKFNIYEQLFLKHDDFSWIIGNSIENHIRNSIGHFNYEENIDKQTIIFIDDHKGKSTKKTKMLIEVARNCVYMFYTLMNLLELNYNILKIQTIIK